MLEGHGDDGYRFSQNIRADFSTNVWYGGDPKELKHYLFDRWEVINRYPEVLGESLSEKVAAHYELSSANILVNNGSTESIYLVTQAWQKSRATIVYPSFSEYEDACTLYQHSIAFLSWEDLRPDSICDTDLLFLCNPNNPTGAVFHDLEALIRRNPHTIFVIDEAFIDFTRAVSSVIQLVAIYNNLIILHSLTKTFAIPGLRLGYIAANEKLIDKLKAFKFPWSVNALALEAGKYIFDHFEAVQIPLDDLLRDKEKFVEDLRREGLGVFDSETHFFLAELKDGTASELKQYLIENFGLLIRDASNFRGLGEKCFRVAALSPEKNQLLIEALREWKNR